MDSSGRYTLRNRNFLRKYFSEDTFHPIEITERNTREATPAEPTSMTETKPQEKATAGQTDEEVAG